MLRRLLLNENEDLGRTADFGEILGRTLGKAGCRLERLCLDKTSLGDRGGALLACGLASPTSRLAYLSLDYTSVSG